MIQNLNISLYVSFCVFCAMILYNERFLPYMKAYTNSIVSIMLGRGCNTNQRPKKEQCSTQLSLSFCNASITVRWRGCLIATRRYSKGTDTEKCHSLFNLIQYSSRVRNSLRKAIRDFAYTSIIKFPRSTPMFGLNQWDRRLSGMTLPVFIQRKMS